MSWEPRAVVPAVEMVPRLGKGAPDVCGEDDDTTRLGWLADDELPVVPPPEPENPPRPDANDEPPPDPEEPPLPPALLPALALLPPALLPALALLPPALLPALALFPPLLLFDAGAVFVDTSTGASTEVVLSDSDWLFAEGVLLPLLEPLLPELLLFEALLLELLLELLLFEPLLFELLFELLLFELLLLPLPFP